MLRSSDITRSSFLNFRLQSHLKVPNFDDVFEMVLIIHITIFGVPNAIPPSRGRILPHRDAIRRISVD